uniref:CD99 antigen-like isoform X5 n=1 Tax=Petromyzon marinus TaxID=7757 RepID=A0AAJ7XFX2_PETMA|nr:CD99 antigen-like isoform X5 [Petromyzon marinus]
MRCSLSLCALLPLLLLLLQPAAWVEGQRSKGKDFDDDDLLGYVNEKPTPKPPKGRGADFSDDDLFGLEPNNKPPPKTLPKDQPAKVQPNQGSKTSGGSFSDSDLGDGGGHGASNTGQGGTGQNPDTADNYGAVLIWISEHYELLLIFASRFLLDEGELEPGGNTKVSPGASAGIAGGVIAAVVAAISAFIAYKRRQGRGVAGPGGVPGQQQGSGGNMITSLIGQFFGGGGRAAANANYGTPGRGQQF